MLAEDWAEDLEAFPWDVVEISAKRLRRENSFFPCVAEMSAQCREILAERTAHIALSDPAEISPMQMERGLKALEDIKAILRNKGGNPCGKRMK